MREVTVEVPQTSSSSSRATVRGGGGGGEEESRPRGNFHTNCVRQMANINFIKHVGAEIQN